MEKSKFVEAVHNANKRLYQYACSLTKNNYDAEDLLQEAIERTYKKVDTGEEIDNIEAYIIQVMKRIYYNENKRKERMLKILQIFASGFDIDEQEKLSDILGLITDKETTMELERALKRLRRSEKQIIILHYGFGESLSEIARITGLRYDTVMHQRQRALKKLKILLEKRDGNPFIMIIFILP